MAWTSIIVAYLLCIYDTFPWHFGQPYHPIWSSILSSMNGLLWSLILTMIIFICITNPESFVAIILSWQFFRPLSRMTFSVFLTHFLVVYIIRDTSRNLFDLHYPSILMISVAALMLAYIFGFIFTLLFESPIVSIFTMIRKRFILSTVANGNKIDNKMTTTNISGEKSYQIELRNHNNENV